MHPLHQMRTTGSDWRLVHIRKLLETNIRFVRVICGQFNNDTPCALVTLLHLNATSAIDASMMAF